jgi:creatinase
MPYPFPETEFADRHEALRDILELHGLDAILLTSARNLAWAFGLPSDPAAPQAAALVRAEGGRLHLALTDPRAGSGPVLRHDLAARDGLWRALVADLGPGRALGVEADTLNMVQGEMLNSHLRPGHGVDVSRAIAGQRMIKSAAELALIRTLAAAARQGVNAALADPQSPAAPEQARLAMQAALTEAFPGQLAASARVVTLAAPGGAVTSLGCLPVFGGYAAPLWLATSPDPSLRALHDAALDQLVAGLTCDEIAARLDPLIAAAGQRQIAPFGRGLDLCDPAGARFSGLDLSSGIETVLEPGMILGFGPALSRPEGGVLRAQSLVLIGEEAPEVIASPL